MAESSSLMCPRCGKSFKWQAHLASQEILCVCATRLKMPADPQSPLEVARPRVGPASGSGPVNEVELNLKPAPKPKTPPKPAPAPRPGAFVESPPGEGIECPSCGKRLPGDALLCVPCGIDIHTGRSFLTEQPSDIPKLYQHARDAFSVLSWFSWLGMFPFASEARTKPRRAALWMTAIVTIAVSVWFYALEVSESQSMRKYKTLLLWSGMEPTNGNVLIDYYSSPEGKTMGDYKAFEASLAQVLANKGFDESKVTKEELNQDLFGAFEDWDVAPDAKSRKKRELFHASAAEAYEMLTPEQKVMGEFHGYQLITHTLLHGGFWHLAGNLLFFFLFGAAINGLIGNVGFAVIYPLLGIAAGLIQHYAAGDEPRSASLGASGAIMGLAGMYMIFFPIHKVHVAAYIRLPLLVWFPLFMKVFACRGYTILLFFIGQDAFFLLLGVKTGTGHWAHMGGFITGAVIAVVLLMTRAVNAQGGDLLTAFFGRYAWPLIGKPSQWAKKGVQEGWLQRLRLPSRTGSG